MEVLTNIGFDWQVALANFVTFLIIFFILKYKVFGPVGKILDDRREKIAAGLAKAIESEEQSKRTQEESQEILMQARTQANGLLAEAQTRSDALVNDASIKAQNEATKIFEQNKERIEHEQTLAMREVEREASRLVVLAVERVLGKKVDQDQDLELAQATIEQLQDRTKISSR